jgi:hypothetical protein
MFAKADYTDYKDGVKYTCTADLQSCQPQTREGACVNGWRTVTVIACDGSTKSFSEACEEEKVHSCGSCDESYSGGKYMYTRLINGDSMGGTVISGFRSFDACMDAQYSDHWCQGQ